MKKFKLFLTILLGISVVFVSCKDPEVEHKHNFSEKWEIDEYYHWKKCSCGEIDFEAEHSFGDWQVIKAATEEAEGKQERKCTVCPYTATEVIKKLAHTHKFATDWTKDATHHWHASTCGHEVTEGKVAHTFGNWTTTKAATEEAEGSKERTCTVCDYKATEVIEKLAHTHKFATDWTKDGTNHWHVSTCGHEVTDGKAVHTFGEWQVTKEATCIEKGERKATCTVCDFEKTEVSEKAKHSFGEYVSNNDATTEADGTKTRECSVCGYKDTVTDEGSKIHMHTFAEKWTIDSSWHWYAATCGHDVTDSKAAHSFGGWTVTKEATEEAEGTKERSCTVCGYTATEAIEKLAHTHKFATDWTKDETNHWYASTCGHTTEVSEKAKHSFGEYVSNNDATTEADGTKTRECSVCGYKDTVTDEGSKIHVHTFAEKWTIDSSWHWYAATCGHDVTDSKAAHSFGEYVSNNDATTEADGTKTRECSVCGYKDTVTDEGSKIIVHEMVFVKGATVTGALPAWLDESASDWVKGVFIKDRTVTLSDFYMGKYEVTQEEYASVMAGQTVTVNGTEYALESNPSYCTADSTRYTLFNGDVQEKRPVERVTWYDAVWYCNALSEKKGLTKAYNIEVTQVKQESGKTGYYIYSANVTLNKNATGYRLPTEAEWEYAARGGDPTAADWNYLFSGADTAEGVAYYEEENSGLDSVGWYSYNNNKTGITGNSDVTNDFSGNGTHQVGKKAPNRLGLYDLSGNVWEWCYDRFGTVNKGEETDPTGAASGSDRVSRGGSWANYDASIASVFQRACGHPNGSSGSFIGFRVVRPSSN